MRRDAHTGGRINQHAIRVLCVDDHAVLIEGLRAQFAIEGRITVVGTLPSSEGLLEEVTRLGPDAVLIDVEMPGPDAFEMADRLRHMHPGVRVVFLSAHIRDGFISAAFRSGASGYFAKSDEPEDIVAGLHEIARSVPGCFIMGPKVRRHCQPAQTGSAPADGPETRGADAPPQTPLDRLTPREIEIVRLIGKGLSRTQIAHELCRSAKTVDGHQERILKKLGLDSRAELMRLAIREGLAEI